MADREPLVLLHGLGMSSRVWDATRRTLEPHHDVIAVTTLGHRGGSVPVRRPVTIADLVDDVERILDERVVDRPHVAGNSLGGWMALELARRGRARSVCALSPAGTWAAGTPEQTDGVRKIRQAARAARLGRPLPFLMRSARVRRLAFRDVAEHGERLTPAQAVETTTDLLSCTILNDILTTGEELAPLDPSPCPVTLVWSADDRILPLAVNGGVARRRVPGARFVVLPAVGHVPMIDDPSAVAVAVLAATGAERAVRD
jgi:pimeloyl-ACP methyl ester carboxylesterase